MKLELHPSAAKSFDEKADILLSKLVQRPRRSLYGSDRSFSPDLFVAHCIEEENIIGEPCLSVIDEAGIQVAKYFWHDGKYIGIHGETYKELVDICEQMGRRKELREVVSVTLLANLVFDWMKEKYKNITGSSMTEYVLSKCEESIKEFEIWIPIAMLHIQSEIMIGKVILKTIAKDLFDRWRAELKPGGDSDIIQEMFDREQKELQGHTAAVIKLCAEPIRAYEIALEETEKSISLFRFFSRSNFDPEINSYCAVLGRENLEKTKYWVMQEGKLAQVNRGIFDESARPWVINDTQLAMFKNEGLEILSDLLLQENKTAFQEKLLESLLLYSGNSLARTPTDKLVYILVALESILLANENEPIQQSIGDRMAFFIGRNSGERKSITKRLKEAYDLRSKFLHHGRTVEDLVTLKEFMIDVYRFFHQLIHNANRFETVEQLIEAIEERKYA